MAAKKKARAGQAKTRAPKKEREYAEALAQLEAAGDRVALDIDGESVTLTHLDKVLWPAGSRTRSPTFTRRDFVRYLLEVGPYMLPHIEDRPLTLIRMPEGAGGRRFVQFHWEQRLPPFVETVGIWSEKSRIAEDFLLCNNMPTLLWLAHVGTLELHVWHSRASTVPDAKGASTDYASSAAAVQRSILNHPDYIVFDIDPYMYSGQEEKGGQPEFNVPAFEKAKQVALWLKALLDSLKVKAFVKTSGKTGLHVLVPVVRTIDYDLARAFAETLARHLAREHPEDITLDWNVTRRSGKIFMDYAMNVRVKTLSAPYSLRALPGAPASMPLSWKALPKAHPLDHTIANVAQVLAKEGDIWRAIVSAKQDLAQVLAQAGL